MHRCGQEKEDHYTFSRSLVAGLWQSGTDGEFCLSPFVRLAAGMTGSIVACQPGAWNDKPSTSMGASTVKSWSRWLVSSIICRHSVPSTTRPHSPPLPSHPFVKHIPRATVSSVIQAPPSPTTTPRAENLELSEVLSLNIRKCQTAAVNAPPKVSEYSCIYVTRDREFRPQLCMRHPRFQNTTVHVSPEVENVRIQLCMHEVSEYSCVCVTRGRKCQTKAVYASP